MPIQKSAICNLQFAIIAAALVFADALSAQDPLASPLIISEAHLLPRGEIVFVLRNRYFHIPSRIVAGLRIQPNLGIAWAPTNWLGVGLEAQTVDNAGPGTQGGLSTSRTTTDSGSGNFFQELTVSAKVRIRATEDRARALSLAASLSNGNRSYLFRDVTTGVVTAENKQSIVARLDLPGTWTDARWRITLSPTVAFFEADNALYLRRPPVSQPGRFGTTAGVSAGIVVGASPAWMFWGDVFLPVTGNNTINRTSGLPARTPTYNSGVRFSINPALAADVFVSNALGDTGPLGLVADREYRSLGVAVAVAPRRDTRSTSGRTLGAAGAASLRVADHAAQVAIHARVVSDLDAAMYVDQTGGTTDESLLGVSGSLRVIDQAGGSPVTVRAELSASRSNNVFVNLLAGRADEFERLGLEKSGFSLGDEDERAGKVYVLTLAAPVERSLGNVSLRAAPIVGLVQRRGVQLAGLRVDGSASLTPTLRATAGGGLTFGSRGNALVSDGRVHRATWQGALGWSPPWLGSRLGVAGYVGNRVGESAFLSMRALANGGVGVGLGVVARLW